MPGADEFDEIVAKLRRETSARRRTLLLRTSGVLLVLGAFALILFGGVEGAVYAVAPWIIGLVLVVRSTR